MAFGQLSRPWHSRLQACALPRTWRWTILRPQVIFGESLGIALPIDPGSHVIEASAPGKQAWKTSFEITRDGETKSLAESGFYQQPGTEIAKVTNRLEAVHQELQTAYARWETLDAIYA